MTGALLAIVLAAAEAAPAAPPAPTVTARWMGREMPLPMTVKGPQDLAFKGEAERQYLIFNLMADGRLAYEAGDFARAAREWEALLMVPSLPGEVARVVSPLLAEAQRRRPGGSSAGGPPLASASLTSPPPPAAAARAPLPPPAPATPPTHQRATVATVSGTVTGGGAVGPGAAVLWLKRVDGPTPLPKASRWPRVVNQANKSFVPHVLAIPLGETVDFRNDDPFFHNVFSRSNGQAFDAGLYNTGRSYTRTFNRPGPVELLCNIHSSMIGYLYVVDSAYYVQPHASGAFQLHNVPPGRYELYAWHESSAEIVKQAVTVDPGGVRNLAVRIPGDRSRSLVVPDKYGTPRQPQLGY